jgi:hypothetical protein
MKRKIYHVVWRDSAWHVRRPRARRSTAQFTQKKHACLYAEIASTMARCNQIVIHGKNGRIQREYTYGDDPRRTAG